MNSRFKLAIVTSSTVLVVLLLVGAAANRGNAAPDDAYRHLAVYTEVLSRIKSEYVEEPDIKNVTLGAMNGLLEAVDPFASYLTADQYKLYLKNQEAKKAGVGMVLSRKFGYIGVVNVVPGSPAAKAGLTTGDMLESINGVATRDMPLAFAEMALNGDSGTTVELSVLRVRKPEPQKVTLTRSAVRLPSVTSKMLPDSIGLVQAPALSDGRIKEVQQQIEALSKQGAKKFILDLRNSGFSKPEDGVALANLFMEKGSIGYLEGQKISRENFSADPARAPFKNQPLIVLTNRGTSNGAEVATAALLESKRAESVGEKTYGDAAMRKAISMDDGSAVLLAVAKYYSPSGKSLMDGVSPTVAVVEAEAAVAEEEDDQEIPVAPEPRKDEDDTILKKAVEILTKGKETGSQASSSGPQGLPERKNPLTIQK